MVDRMGENFKPHVTTVLPAVIDRLGDSKDQVRDMAQQLLLKLMMPASTPQVLNCLSCHTMLEVRSQIVFIMWRF